VSASLADRDGRAGCGAPARSPVEACASSSCARGCARDRGVGRTGSGAALRCAGIGV